MSATENLLAGLPGTSNFNSRSFFWGFALCLVTAVTLQLTKQNPHDFVVDGVYGSRYLPPAEVISSEASAAPANQAAVAEVKTDVVKAVPAPDSCASWFPEQPEGNDPWRAVKMVGRPSACLIKGHFIEELDPDNNFRRSYTLGFTDYVEDKTFLLPWLLAARDGSLAQRKRRIYLDLGANYFATSVTWFLRAYPLDFTEVHAFERVKGRFVIPSTSTEDITDIDGQSRKRVKGAGPVPLPPWQLNRIKAYDVYVGAADNPARSTINITRFIKNELKVTTEDTLIVKMDVEGAEWAILDAWLQDPEMPGIIDELFVEIHYKHPSMKGFGWMAFGHTREQATELLNSLRAAGFFTHSWP